VTKLTKTTKSIFAFSLGLSAIALFIGIGLGGNEQDMALLAARWTARLGLPIFVITYMASSVAYFWPNISTRNLLKYRQQWGLAFATVHTIHLMMVIWTLRVSTEPLDWPGLAIAFIPYILMYAMVLTSNGAAMRMLGRKWKYLHFTGMNVLFYGFAQSYVERVLTAEHFWTGCYGLALLIPALVLRVAMMWRRHMA